MNASWFWISYVWADVTSTQFATYISTLTAKDKACKLLILLLGEVSGLSPGVRSWTMRPLLDTDDFAGTRFWDYF